MAEWGRIAFLEQAGRNNWQEYVASLRGDTAGGWDVCLLTASDDRQAAVYRRQLDWRREAGLLPAGARFEVIPDPEGRRIGSGGATLRALRTIEAFQASATGRERGGPRVLLIHSGGDSRRLPHASAAGKLFARVPRHLPDGRASTIFDEFLISLSGLVRGLPPGVLVASGDVLLVFDPLQVSFRRGGVIGVAAAVPAEMGTRHGVYVRDPGHPRVLAYLHKPSLETLDRHRALAPDGTVQVDTGLVWLDARVAGVLAGLADADVVSGLPAGNPLNLYGDLLLPLSPSTTLEGYRSDTSDGPATPAIREARDLIWERMRGIPLSVERLQPAVFLHFGTSLEYWRMTASDPELARMCGWVPRAASWVADREPEEGSGPVCIHSVLESAPSFGEAPAVILDSYLKGPVRLQGRALVSGLHASGPLSIRPDVVVHQMPVSGGFVTRVFGLLDDPKRAWEDPAATFMNVPWQDWLDRAGVGPEAVWPAGPGTLWDARLFPLTRDREESLRLALPLQDPAHAPEGWVEAWRGAARLSLAESFLRADGEALLGDLLLVEDAAAARRFIRALESEQPAPAAGATLHLTRTIAERRANRAAELLAAADPMVRLRGYRALAEVSGHAGWDDRAFGLLSETISAAVLGSGGRREPGVGSGVRLAEAGGSVRVMAAARLDFGGGWTDTPPHSLEKGGTVLNAAVTLRGEYPILAEGIRLEEPRLILESQDIDAEIEPLRIGEVLEYADPADPFALHKAALVLRGLVPVGEDPQRPIREHFRSLGGGLRLVTRTLIPRGSGLGTSSIMAGAVLACLGQMTTAEPSPERLFDEVLCLEQMLTTGGGWQDQVGGLVGGIKLITTAPGLPQRIRTEPVELPSETRSELADRLVLVYTGQQRLAKNLLRSVMGRWMSRHPDTVTILREIGLLAREMREALLARDLDRFGLLLREHWAHNKRLDPGCTNPFLDELFAVMEPFSCGGKLAGAGGGGFAFVVARDAGAASRLERELAARYPGTPVSVWPCAIPESGLVLTS